VVSGLHKEVEEPGTASQRNKIHLRLAVACEGGGGGTGDRVGAYYALAFHGRDSRLSLRLRVRQPSGLALGRVGSINPALGFVGLSLGLSTSCFRSALHWVN